VIIYYEVGKALFRERIANEEIRHRYITTLYEKCNIIE